MIISNLKRLSGFKNSLIFLIIVVFYCVTGEPLMAQKENLKNIITLFKDYSSLDREVAYCHLNKSTFIKGEMIGFSGYVFDKDLKVPSKLTKNLYCVITDNNNKVIKSKMVKVNNGFTNNVFKIDSLFTSGNYTFTAYTNWMKNFDESNAFVESFRVIDPEVESIIKKTVTENILDAQFLPEGGYFVDFVKTTVGVIIKNIEGFGVSNVEGNVYDSNNKLIATFKTNSVGIGRFLLYPDINQEYLVKINHLNKAFEFKIDDIKPKGISIHVNNDIRRLAIEFRTNKRTLKDIKGKLFKMTIHNGKEVKGIEVAFKEKNLVKIIDHKELFPGINILTLFDENNVPLLERMIFNYKGVNLFNFGTVNYTKLKDSTRISIPFMKFTNPSVENSNISISVLPEETKSYQKHHNIISHIYLQPYVKGYVENAQYYFTNVDSKKKYDLDNLLITQGWSSYNWENIFNNNVTNNFVFEDGIVLKANQNNNKQRNFIVYPLKFNAELALNLQEGQNSFVISNLYPEGDEKLGIATLNRKQKVKIPSLNTQFFPSKIPDYHNQFEVLHTNQSTIAKSMSKSQFTLFDIKETQILDEVIIKTSAKELKIKSLQEDPFNLLDVFDDTKRNMNLTFVSYLNIFVPQFVAYESRGTVTIFNRVPTTLFKKASSSLSEGGSLAASTPGSPIVYLDDVLMSSLDFFYGYDMNIVDYVTVNRFGMGEGFFGANGVIKMYTSLDFIKKRESNSFKQFEFPLTFSENKKFYVPKYDVYNDDFFKEYGVIDWIPNCKIDNKGNLNFTVYNPANTNFKLFIEGVTDKGEFVSDIKVLNMNDN